MNRHLLALSEIILVTCQLVSHLLDGKSAPKERTCLTVLWEEQVLVVKGRSCADARGFLTELSHVK